MHHSLTGAALLRLLALVLFAGNAFAQTGMTTPGQFSVNESGAATYIIPLTIPPGIGGIEPKLALSYNSQAGNGLLGVAGACLACRQ